MRLLSTTTRKLAAGALAGATILGGGGAAYATTAGHAAHPMFRPIRHNFFAGADHMSAEVQRNGAWVTFDWDRGTVTSYSNTSLTIMRPDGTAATFTITSTTRFRARTKPDLDGDRARVISNSSGDAIVVTLVPPKKAAAGNSGPAGVTGSAS